MVSTYLQVRSIFPGGGLPHAILRLRQKKHASVRGFLGVSSTGGGTGRGACGGDPTGIDKM